jgi:hypothetical protein
MFNINYDPTRYKNADNIHEVMISKNPHSDSLLFRVKESRHWWSFLEKWVHWITTPNERISVVRNVMIEAYSRNEQIAGYSMEQCANLYSNLYFFNKKIIKKHNESWISKIFQSNQIPEIETVYFQTLESQIQSKFNSSPQLQPQAKNLEQFNELLTSTVDTILSTQALESIPDAESLKATREQFIHNFNKQAEEFSKKIDEEARELMNTKSWSDAHQLKVETLHHFLPIVYSQIQIPTAYDLLLKSYAIINTILRDREYNLRTIEKLKKDMLGHLGQLKIKSAAKDPRELLYVSECPEYLEQIRKVTQLERIPREKIKELDVISLNYHSSVAWYRKAWKLCQLIGNSDGSDLGSLEKLHSELQSDYHSKLSEEGRQSTEHVLIQIKFHINNLAELAKVIAKVGKGDDLPPIDEIKTLQDKTISHSGLFFTQNNPLVLRANKLIVDLQQIVEKKSGDYQEYKNELMAGKSSLIKFFEASLGLVGPRLFPFERYFNQAKFEEFCKANASTKEIDELKEFNRELHTLYSEVKEAINVSQAILLKYKNTCTYAKEIQAEFAEKSEKCAWTFKEDLNQHLKLYIYTSSPIPNLQIKIPKKHK